MYSLIREKTKHSKLLLTNLLKKFFAQIRRLTLVFAEINLPFVSYKLKVFLQNYSGRVPGIALIEFWGFLSIIFCTFRTNLSILMIVHLADVLILATAAESSSAAMGSLQTTTNGNFQETSNH